MTLSARLIKKLPHFTIDVEIACPPGSILAVTGPSGSGKTTVLRMLAGLEEPDEGRITLGEEVWRDVGHGVRVAARRRGVGLVFQEYSLFPHMTLAQNVAYATKDTAFAGRLLELFGISQLADNRPGTMSGGERQRGALCQALARRPKALLLDEPFSALDAATRANLRGELLVVREHFAIPIVHVTHDLAEAALLGDQVVTINCGRIDRDWFARQLALYRDERQALLARFDGTSSTETAGQAHRTVLRFPHNVSHKEERPCDASS